MNNVFGTKTKSNNILTSTTDKCSHISFTTYQKIPLNKSLINNVNLENVLQQLYTNFGLELEVLTARYALGQIDELSPDLTYVIFQDLSVKLFNQVYPGSNGYTKIHELVGHCLQGLYKSVILNMKQQTEIEQHLALIDTLQNPRKERTLLQTEATLDTVATIKPEILIYFQTYGFECGIAPDPTRLAEIIAIMESG